MQYYAAGGFGTDRYPPFTLADDPAYPARLEIAYPQRLSRGLALVKWWLLAIPHYIVVAVFTGGGVWAVGHLGRSDASWPGLISILTLIAAVVLLFTGRYPRQLFDLVVGLNRWVLRVAAYAALMTDQYPPFRLDQGGHEPGALIMPPWPGPGLQPGPAGGSPPPRRSGWTSGRVACAIGGALLAVVSLGLLGAGGAASWATTAGRQAGYLNLGSEAIHAQRLRCGQQPRRAAGPHSRLGRHPGPARHCPAHRHSRGPRQGIPRDRAGRTGSRPTCQAPPT